MRLGIVCVVVLGLGCSSDPGWPQQSSQQSSPLTAGAWPVDQLLPSFPAAASTQDLIILHGKEQHWEAEGQSLSHKAGRLETDGWLCQVGVDAPNAHMIYGPYDVTVPAGDNTALFRMKIDDNAGNDDQIVIIEAYDSTDGRSLASRAVTRRQFTVAGAYTTFSLPFTLPADSHALELRVSWSGAAYTKVDWVGVTRSQAEDEMVLFASLKGVVNAKQPRIFSYEGDAFAEGPHAWLESLGLAYTEVANPWDLITKYLGELGGIIVYDNAVPDTINLATTLAGAKKALVVAPSLAARLRGAPYNLPVLMDLRGQFADKLAVYRKLYTDYWPALTHRLAFGLNPLAVRAAVREYAVAVGAAAMWLDPAVPAEGTLLDQFLSSMGAGAVWMGWWPDEAAGVTAASKHGVATVASDYCTNLTVHSGTPRTIGVKPPPPKPALSSKIYVAFVLSDGDNLQFVEHLLRKLWNDPGRGKVPIGWTLSPAMVDAMPGALNYLWTTGTPNDAFISGPSGYGYTYPNLWTDGAALDRFVAKTEKYDERAGFRIVTIWNTITGGINPNVGSSFARNAPSLLGVTAQNTGGGLTVYENRLPGMALTCNYCTGEQAMKDFIAMGAAGWNRAEQRFLFIQAQPWQGVTPTSFQNVARSLGGDYVVVRPDHLFQLIREAKSLPINPTVTFSIVASAGKHGSIAPSGPVNVDLNGRQRFTFTPDPGYTVKEISVDGVAVAPGLAYEFVNVTDDHTIAVAFEGGGEPDAGVVDAAVERGAEDASAPGGATNDGAAKDANDGAAKDANDGAAKDADQPVDAKDAGADGVATPARASGCACDATGGSSMGAWTLAAIAIVLASTAARGPRRGCRARG